MDTMEEHMKRVIVQITKTKQKIKELESRLGELKSIWKQTEKRKIEKEEALLELNEISDQIISMKAQEEAMVAPEEVLQFKAE